MDSDRWVFLCSQAAKLGVPQPCMENRNPEAHIHHFYLDRSNATAANILSSEPSKPLSNRQLLTHPPRTRSFPPLERVVKMDLANLELKDYLVIGSLTGLLRTTSMQIAGYK